MLIPSPSIEFIRLGDGEVELGSCCNRYEFFFSAILLLLLIDFQLGRFMRFPSQLTKVISPECLDLPIFSQKDCMGPASRNINYLFTGLILWKRIDLRYLFDVFAFFRTDNQ